MSQVNQSDDADEQARAHSAPNSNQQSAGSVRSVLSGPRLPGTAYAGMSAAVPRSLELEDVDSAMGGDGHASSSQSMTSSTMQFRFIHGRQYHREVGDAQYWGAIDEQQRASLDLIHHVLTLACRGKLVNAPLDQRTIRKVLDVGSGTGSWAMDFADENPHVEVIGTDLSPMQPFWVSPNLRFEIEDCTQDWTYGPNSFDYVHMRWLIGSIKDWPGLFEQAFRVCKPGGWVESFEPSLTLTNDNRSISDHSAIGRWGKLFAEGGRRTGASFTVVEEGVQERAMRAAGFVDIGSFSFKCPIGNWPKEPRLKEMGRFAQLGLTSDVEGFILHTALLLGWSKEEVDAYAVQLERELLSGRHQPFHWQKVVWGRKPAGN